LRHATVHGRLNHALKECIARAEHRCQIAARSLHVVSPLATLARGFAVIRSVSDGKVITNADAVSVGDQIEARLDKGTLKASVTEKGG